MTQEATELPPHRLAMLRRFFQDYKKLEGKAVEVDEFQPARDALPVIQDAVERYWKHRRNDSFTPQGNVPVAES
jgi:inorganic pyrophosphatase